MSAATMKSSLFFQPHRRFFGLRKVFRFIQKRCCYSVLAMALTTASAQVLDLSGNVVEPMKTKGKNVVVLIFVRSDCPISNRYAPEIKRLAAQFATSQFYLVYPGADESIEAIRQHQQAYEYNLEALRDPHHELVKTTGVKVTPEAAVFVSGKLVYRGRIDNRVVAFGNLRPAPTIRDLQQALVAVRKGTTRIRKTTAVGCFI
jgi:peroxiredoxin